MNSCEVDLCISILEFKLAQNFCHSLLSINLCISILEFKLKAMGTYWGMNNGFMYFYIRI